jgi:hypothetical protein
MKIGTLLMAFIMTNIPNVLLAENLFAENQKMISTSDVLREYTREQSENEIRDFMQISQVKEEMMKQGLSSQEVTARLASLSEQEIRQLSSQVKEAHAGGDILLAVLIVVLILYLVRRI